MSQDVIELIGQWESLRSKLFYSSNQKLLPETPAKARMLPPAVAGGFYRPCRFNPLVADSIKSIGAKLSVAAHALGLDTTCIDTVAADPIAATPQELRAAAFVLDKLKLMKPTDQDWITVTAAATTFEIPKGTISKLVKSGAIESNGKEGRARRINPTSVVAYKQRMNHARL